MDNYKLLKIKLNNKVIIIFKNKKILLENREQ